MYLMDYFEWLIKVQIFKYLKILLFIYLKFYNFFKMLKDNLYKIFILPKNNIFNIKSSIFL